MLSDSQRNLKLECKNLNEEFNLKNLFTKPRLQRIVEDYLYEIFKGDIKDAEIFFLIHLIHDL